MTLETWPTVKKSTFELRQMYFFFRRQSIALDELIEVYVIHFLVENFLQEMYQFKSFKGVDNFSSKVRTETKNRPIQKWYQMCLLNFKSSLAVEEFRVYPLLFSK